MQATGLTTVQEDILYDWIESVLSPFGVEIAWAFPDEPEQNKPYCILSVPVKPKPEHMPSTEYNSVDTIDHRFHNVFTFSVKIYADDGNDYIRRIIKSQYYELNIERLKLADMTCRYDVGTYFLPEVVSDRFEYREGVDFIMAYSEIDSEVVGEIREVELQGTIKGTVDSVDIEKNWTITQ